MNEDSTRRDFLGDASLAGMALVVGGGLLSVAGCGDECKETGRKKVCGWWDDRGFLFVADPDLAAKLSQIYQTLPGQLPPPGGSIKGIQVHWADPNSNQINSLCSC